MLITGEQRAGPASFLSCTHSVDGGHRAVVFAWDQEISRHAVPGYCAVFTKPIAKRSIDGVSDSAFLLRSLAAHSLFASGAFLFSALGDGIADFNSGRFGQIAAPAGLDATPL
jgi:hypothetical protein